MINSKQAYWKHKHSKIKGILFQMHKPCPYLQPFVLCPPTHPYHYPCACVQDYVLNFGLWEKHVDNAWHGGVATIEFCPGAEVWGVIWTLSNDNLKSLDK